MDLESDCSALDSSADNDANPADPPTLGDVQIEESRTCNHDDHLQESNLSEPDEGIKMNSSEHASAKLQQDSGSRASHPLTSQERMDTHELANSTEKEVEIARPISSSALPTNGSPENQTKPPSPTNTKGLGLRKWRRIRREVSKDGSPSLDSGRMLKRGLPGSANLGNPVPMSSQMTEKGDASISSTNAFVNIPGGADCFASPGSSSIYKLSVGSTFSVGADSDNTEDGSSKSSTAASAPKSRYDVPRVSGYQREKYKTKNPGGKNVVGVAQRFQQGKTQADTTKKHRGENIDAEKENSLSSMESDSRSSAFVFNRGTCSTVGDERQSRKATNCDGENGYDMLESEQQSVEKLPAGHSNHGSRAGDLSPDNSVELSWEGIEGTSKNHQPSRDVDPLVDTVVMLQSVQEALEKEIQKFGDIGKDLCSLWDDSGRATGVHEQSEFISIEGCQNCLSNDGGTDCSHVMNSAQNVKTLERQLEEARCMLNEKELRIVELEAGIKHMTSSEENLQKRQLEMEADLEELYKHKIKAEVEYFVMTRLKKDLGVLVENQVRLLEEQKSLAREQLQSVRALTSAENTAAVLKDQAEELEKQCRDVTERKEAVKMQESIAKFTSCFLIQLILLVLILWLFIMKLWPQSEAVVPT